MDQFTVGEFKAKFSDVLERVKKGESVSITYGKSKKRVAAIVPYKNAAKPRFKLGLLDGKASVKFHRDFKMSIDEFLGS